MGIKLVRERLHPQDQAQVSFFRCSEMVVVGDAVAEIHDLEGGMHYREGFGVSAWERALGTVRRGGRQSK
jgi:hypothetical protein